MIMMPLSPEFRRCIGLLLAVVCFNFWPHTLHADSPNVVGQSAADQAWQTLEHDRDTPPEPLKQLPDRMYTQQEIRGYYTKVANRAGEVAEEAKQFYTHYPNHPQAAVAREVYFDMLHAAVTLSSTNKIAELEAVTAERQRDPKLDDEARFQLALRLLHSAVSGRQYESDDAMRAELEKRARQLAVDYPSHPEGNNFLRDMARNAAPEKLATLAREIMARTSDEPLKKECQGLIHRAEAVGKPLPLTLPLTDGTTLNLDKLQGKVVLLLLWSSTSQFSSKALWAVDQLYQKNHAQGLEVVGLNFDEDQARARSMLKDSGIKWPQYLDGADDWQIQQQYGVHSLPLCWFMDKKGVLRELKGERDPNGILARLLAEP